VFDETSNRGAQRGRRTAVALFAFGVEQFGGFVVRLVVASLCAKSASATFLARLHRTQRVSVLQQWRETQKSDT
jgi:hypothetical protein